MIIREAPGLLAPGVTPSTAVLTPLHEYTYAPMGEPACSLVARRHGWSL
jgi:hypothetical protein